MASDNELVRLEEYIERLLSGYSKLKKEKQNIEQRLGELQAENDKYRQELESIDSERGVMRDRVNSLIGQIEQWEAEIEGEEGDDGSSSEDDEEEDAEEDPEEDEPPVKKKGRAGKGAAKAQKNLFSG
jgi:flagellar biosynthesis chaperone FliJ